MGSKRLIDRAAPAVGFFERDYSDLKYYRPEQLEQLRARVTTQTPEVFWSDSAWDVSDPSFRQLALLYYAQGFDRATNPAEQTEKALQLDATRVVHGNFSVDGNLVIGAGGSLVVLGDLEVGGNIVVAADYPTLFVAGEIRAANFFASQSETIALHGIRIQDIFALKYNHTVVLAPKTQAAVCALDDAFPDTEFESHAPGTKLESYAKLGVEFLQAKIDPSFEDTHQNEDEYYEMLDYIDDRIRSFFVGDT